MAVFASEMDEFVMSEIAAMSGGDYGSGDEQYICSIENRGPYQYQYYDKLARGDRGAELIARYVLLGMATPFDRGGFVWPLVTIQSVEKSEGELFPGSKELVGQLARPIIQALAQAYELTVCYLSGVREESGIFVYENGVLSKESDQVAPESLSEITEVVRRGEGDRQVAVASIVSKDGDGERRALEKLGERCATNSTPYLVVAAHTGTARAYHYWGKRMLHVFEDVDSSVMLLDARNKNHTKIE